MVKFSCIFVYKTKFVNFGESILDTVSVFKVLLKVTISHFSILRDCDKHIEKTDPFSPGMLSPAPFYPHLFLYPYPYTRASGVILHFEQLCSRFSPACMTPIRHIWSRRLLLEAWLGVE